MNIYFVPSLQHLTLAKIGIVLCDHPEIKALLAKRRCHHCGESDGRVCIIQTSNYFAMLDGSRLCTSCGHTSDDYNHSNDLLKQVQDRVRGMVSQLNLGTPTLEKIIGFIPNIVLDIKSWKIDHFEVLPAGYDAQVYFCWKSVGTIDRESTAENLLNHGNLSVRNQFHLACLYCMQNRLSSLWDRLYDSYKAHLISESGMGSVLEYWTTYLDGFHSRRSVFPTTTCITNVSALQYFYNQCFGERKKRTLLIDVLTKHRTNLDLIRFCIAKLSQHGYDSLSSLECRGILICYFLNRLLQSVFLDVFECLQVKLEPFGVFHLLEDILKIINDYKYYDDDDYLNLFKQLWEQIPFDKKNSLIDSPDFQRLQTALQEKSSKLLTTEWFHQQKKKMIGIDL